MCTVVARGPLTRGGAASRAGVPGEAARAAAAGQGRAGDVPRRGVLGANG